MVMLRPLLVGRDLSALQQTTANQVHATLEEAVTIQQIPAPTFAEQARAAYVQERFVALGLSDISTDDLYNVYGCFHGTDRNQPALLVSAHTDTVFEAETPLTVQRSHQRISGPGIGDNSLGVAALLSLAETLRTLTLPVDIWIVANTREEGMGDLGGIRAVYERLKSRLGMAIVLEGMAYGRIYHAGIAVRRLQISVRGPGGHSWLHFGRPSAVHALLRLGASIASLQPPEYPRTTYNIGVIEGGRSVNTIAPEASMLLDLRSEDKETLALFEQVIRKLVNDHRQPDLEFTVRVVGDRPAGSIPRSHPLVALARQVLESLGATPYLETGSTDANVLLAAGLPTVTIGIAHGSNAHRVDEYIETEQVADGLWQLLQLTLATSQLLATDKT